jgi:hypothetical protein
MPRILVALAALLFPLIASAATHTLSCTAPTKFTDGTSITTPVAYKFFVSIDGAAEKLLTSTAVTNCGYVVNPAPLGKSCYTATAIAMGAESAHTAQSCLTNAAPADRDGDGVPDASDACPDVKGTMPDGCPTKPEPPTLITGSTSAYESRPASTTAPLALVGLAPLGAPCGPETKVINGTTYCRVPKTAVDAVVWPQNLALNELWVKAAPP